MMNSSINNYSTSLDRSGGMHLVISVDDVFYTILLFVLIIEFNSDFKEIAGLRFAVLGILIAQFCFMLFLFSKKLAFTYYLKWSILMLSAYAISILWCLDREFSVQMLKNIIIEMLISNMVVIVTDSQEKHEKLVKTLFCALIINNVYVIARIGITNVGMMRLGRDYESLRLWDDNYIGYMAAFTAMLAYYFIKNCSKQFKPLFILFFIFGCFVNINTGSRGALIVIVGFLIIDYYLSGRGIQKLKRIFLILAGILVLLFAIYHNDTLYNLIGVRIDRFFQTINGTGFREHSTSERLLLLTNGFKWFTQKPILGYGLDSFRTLFNNAWGILYYAHNNYLELLVDLGLVGTIIYYALYGKIIKRYSFFVFKEHDYKSIFYFTLLIMIMVSEIIGITYYVVLFQMMLVLIYSYSQFLPTGDFGA